MSTTIVSATTPRTGEPPIITAERRTYRAFSLIELVIVILIMATISAIAVPRIVKAAEGVDISALKADFAELNKAVELYHVEHGAYPSENKIVQQLTKYTNAAGNTSDAPNDSGGYLYGPYLHKIPPLPLGPNEGATLVKPAHGPGVGWIYRAANHIVYPNLYNDAGVIPPDVDGRVGENFIDNGVGGAESLGD